MEGTDFAIPLLGEGELQPWEQEEEEKKKRKKSSLAELIAAQRAKEEYNKRIDEYLAKPNENPFVSAIKETGKDFARVPGTVGRAMANAGVDIADQINQIAALDPTGRLNPYGKEGQRAISKELGQAKAGLQQIEEEKGVQNDLLSGISRSVGGAAVSIPVKYANPVGLGVMAIEGTLGGMTKGQTADDVAQRIMDDLGADVPEDKRSALEKLKDTWQGAKKGARDALFYKFVNRAAEYAKPGMGRVLAEGLANAIPAGLQKGATLDSVISEFVTGAGLGLRSKDAPQRDFKSDVAKARKYVDNEYRKAFFGLPANAVAGIGGGGGKPPVKQEAPKDIADMDIGITKNSLADVLINPKAPQKVVETEKKDIKSIINKSISSGDFQKGGLVRFTNPNEIEYILKNGTLPISEAFGAVHASPITDGENIFAAYGRNGEHSVAIYIPPKYNEGPTGEARNNTVNPNVNPQELRFIVDGHKGLYTIDQLAVEYAKGDIARQTAIKRSLSEIKQPPAVEPPVVGKEAQGNSMLDSVAELVDLGSPMSEAQKQFYRANKDAVEARIQELFPETPEEDLTYNDEDAPMGEAELDVPPIATKVPPVDPGNAGKRTEPNIKTPSPEETDRFDDQYIVPSVKAAAMGEIGDATRSVPVDPDAEVIKRATERIDRDGVENVSQELLSRADEKYDNTDAVTGLVAINKLEIGDPVRERLIQKLSDIASKFGQNLRAFGILDPVMYPDIVQRQAHKEAEREDVGLRKRRVKADEEIKKISDNINNVNKETAKTSADDIARETEKFIKGARKAVEKLGGSSEGKDAAVADLNDMIDSMLAQKITRGAGLEEQKPPTESDRKVANEVAQTIYSAISDLAGRVKLKEPSRDDKDLARISTAIQSNEAYAQSLVRAKKILQEKFAGDANAQKVLELIFNSKLIRPFSLKVLDRIVGNEFRSMGGKLSEIIKQHYTAKDSAGKDLEQTLIAKMGLSGEDAQRAAKFIQDSFGKLTNAAKQKALEALYKKRGVPKVERGHIDKVIELSNLGALDRSSLHDIVSQRIGLPVLTKEHMAKLNKVAQEAQALPEFSEERIQKEAELTSLMFQDIPESKRNKLLSYRKVAMLLSFKSAFRNALGGTANVGIDLVAKGVIGKGLDSYITKKINEQLASEGMRQTATKQMTKTDIEMVYREAKKALSFAIEDNFRGVDTMRLRLERDMNIGKPKEQWVHIGRLADKFSTNKSHFKEGGVLNKAQKATGLLLSVPDRAITEGTFRESIANQMKANKESGGTGELTQEMVDQAWREATEVTYRDVNRLSDAIVKLQQHTGTIGELLLTFPRVSANLAHRALVTYSPVGMYRGLRGARKMIKEGVQSFDQPHKIYKGQVDHYTQRRVVMDFSRGATGTAIWGLGAILGYIGTATGAREDDTKAQKTKEAIGKRSSGFNLFGHNVSYDWLMPMASVMGVGVEIGKKLKGDGVSIGGLVDAVYAGTGTMLDQPIFTGISRAIGGRGTPAQKLAYGLSTVAEGVGASFIPTAIGQLRQAVDPYKRKIRVDTGTGIGTDAQDIAMSALRMMVNKIPGLSYVLPKERDILGKPMKYHQSDILGRGIGALIIDPLDRFLNPGIISDIKDDPGIDFVLDLDRKMKKIGGKSPLPKDASRTNGVIINGKRVILTIRQRDKYRKKVGIESHNYIDNFYREGAGDGMTPQEQAETIYRALAQIGSENLQDLKDEIENEQK